MHLPSYGLLVNELSANQRGIFQLVREISPVRENINRDRNYFIEKGDYCHQISRQVQLNKGFFLFFLPFFHSGIREIIRGDPPPEKLGNAEIQQKNIWNQ